MARVFAFIRRYLVPYIHWYVAGTLMLVATNWMSVTIPLYLAHGIDVLEQLGSDGMGQVRNDAIAVALMGICIMAVRFGSRVLFFTPGRLVEAAVKRDLFEKVLRHQPSFLRHWSDGDLMSRASSDVTYARLLAGFAALQVVNTVVAITMGAGQMARLSPRLTVWVAIPLLLAMLIMQFFLRQLFLIMRKLQQETAELSDHILSSYQGVATIREFVAEPAFQAHFEIRNQALLVTTLKRVNLRIFIGPLLSLAASINVCILIYVGGGMAIDDDLSIGQLVAFVTLIAFMTIPLRATSFLLSLLRQAEAAIERLDAVMLPLPDRPDRETSRIAPKTAPSIRVSGLNFAYPDAEESALHDISLDIPAGQTLGVLGLTGSGKTTLLRCLARLYNPPEGTVFIDEVDVRDIDLDDWRRAMTLVPQRPFLFSEPVRDNILLGTGDDETLHKMLSAAALSADIEALPDGVMTQVGEAGLMLSGGQRQRVALARGLNRSGSVLMLDDVLSAVDHTTERQLIDTLRDSGSRPTTIIVAHRISALAHADEIVVMTGGRVVDRGTHEELSSRDGLYRDTWVRQADEKRP
jgi:ATP-binding cassette, subfamily B, multidrug efflux pump